MNIVFMSMDTLPSTLWARDLYDQMHIRSDFHKWFPRMCQYWRSVLFSYARHAGNQQCSGRHGAPDAAGIFLCSVREKRDAP